MYIFIFEDGTINKSRVFGDEEKQAVEDGILDVVDISDSSWPEYYYKGKWVSVESAE